MHLQLFVLEWRNNKFNWQIDRTGKRLKYEFVRDTAESNSLCCFLLFSVTVNDERPQPHFTIFYTKSELKLGRNKDQYNIGVLLHFVQLVYL